MALELKNPPANAGDMRDWIPGPEGALEEGTATTPVLLPGDSQGQRSPAGCSPQGHRELDTTQRQTACTAFSSSELSTPCRPPSVDPGAGREVLSASRSSRRSHLLSETRFCSCSLCLVSPGAGGTEGKGEVNTLTDGSSSTWK